MKKRLAFVAAIGALAVSVALAEDLTVESNSVPIRAGKGGVYDLVATAPKGSKLSVVAREGKWVKVSYNGKEGYVFADALKGGGGNVFAGVGDATGAGMSSGAAGKGLLRGEAMAYAQGKNLDPRPLDWLITFREKVTFNEFDAFAREGKVGPHKQ